MSFSPTVLGSGLSGYAFLTRTREAQQAQFAKTAEVGRDTKKFLEKLKDVQTSDQLMGDRALLKVALGAFGLEADLDNRAFIKKILDSDLSDGGSLANRLADKRYLAFAKTFNFAGAGGPELQNAKSEADIVRELDNIQTADDLLNNPALLRATLSTFGLENDVSNTFFLKSVLESDVSDETSFARRLSDPRYTELAQSFDLAGKAKEKDSIYGFAKTFAGTGDLIRTSDDLMENTDLLNATLKLFGLESDAGKPDFLEQILNSDLNDKASFANQQSDKRYAAFAGVFDFVDRADREASGATFVSTLERFVDTVNATTNRLETPADLFNDFKLMLATFEFFDLPSRQDSAQFANRILTSDRSSPTSLVNVIPDQRYGAFADALGLSEKTVHRTYPAGFAQGIVDNYLERQFEISIGESDPTMRFALSLERDLIDTINSGSRNDSRWFSVMASRPMREVFETIFQLPSSFATLDVDKQLSELKARSERMFGTDDLATFAEPAKMDELRRRYLVASQISVAGSSSAGSIVMALLSSS